MKKEGIYECEKCKVSFKWRFSDYHAECVNIKGGVDNGTCMIVSLRCPNCGFVQQKSLVYNSKVTNYQ